MKRYAWLATLIALGTSSTALARAYALSFTGSVNAIEGEALTPRISIGDPILASFTFDDAAVTGPTVLPIGGGAYSIYNATLSRFALAAGSYSVNEATRASSLVYNDEAFDQDFIVFAIEGLAYGEDSISLQFQFRGPTSAINGAGISNGLPLDRFTPSLFATLSGGTKVERVYGDLNVVMNSAVPEPSTWAMMMIGFVCVGVTSRYRARTAKPIYG